MCEYQQQDIFQLRAQSPSTSEQHGEEEPGARRDKVYQEEGKPRDGVRQHQNPVAEEAINDITLILPIMKECIY